MRITDLAEYRYVFVRHGVILGAGATPRAAVAVLESHVSRGDVRLATRHEAVMARRITRNGRQTPLPESERALLEAIHVDIRRVLARDECGPDGLHAPDIHEYRLMDWELQVGGDLRYHLDEDERDRLEARADTILDELRELDALAHQLPLPLSPDPVRAEMRA